MQFKFDANQEFQITAIEAVADVLQGQSRISAEMRFSLGTGFAAVANRLDLSEAALLENLHAVQVRSKLTADAALEWIEEEIETAEGKRKGRFANFSVEMETGTGKTYVYIRTAMELFRRYGLRKFIVVVPSVAVREGVLKTFQITEKHLRELYDNLPYRFCAYDSDSLSQVRQFAISSSLEFMVMTIDSFNKASNVIRQSTDRLQGETPIHLVQAARPILILDEPQNMESELRVRALAALDPLFALRYSATHRNPYNLVYRLTPFEAYRQGLVKKIEVAGIEKVGDANQVFLRLEEVRTEKRTLTARLAVHKLMKDGTVKEEVVTVRPGDGLEAKTNRVEYAPLVVEEINAGNAFVRFSNGVELRVGESRGADREAIFEAQIRYTVEEHFRKQEAVKEAGIKVLSLFFIDRVDNYVREEGLVRQAFVKAFRELTRQHPEWKRAEVADVHQGYFAERRTRAGEVIYEDSKTGESEKDREAYDLIMRDKERLLSFDEPTCFIFSHSALREGWDSPNVFQICTLNQTTSQMKKRQEIGRGVRLAVNQQGDRVRDERVNVLTVVANESYESYVSRYQAETEEEFGREGVPPRPVNARARKWVKLRKRYYLSPKFKALWQKISQKTRYSVAIDSSRLVENVLAELDKAEIKPPRLVITKVRIEAEAKADLFAAKALAERGSDYTAKRLLPNLIEIMVSLMERTSPSIRLTRRTLLEIFQRAKNRDAALGNPHEFATVAIRIIKEKLADQLVSGIEYERIDAWYEMTQFKAEFESWKEYLIPAERALYDHVEVDSLAADPINSVEGGFVTRLEADETIKFYVKLPSWFVVQTPIGEYNPDWAVVREQRDSHGHPTGEEDLFLVRETKDTTDASKLRPDERRKIACGEKHFKGTLGLDYKVVTTTLDE